MSVLFNDTFATFIWMNAGFNRNISLYVFHT